MAHPVCADRRWLDMKIPLIWLGTTLALWLFLLGANAKKAPEMEADDRESARTDAPKKGDICLKK